MVSLLLWLLIPCSLLLVHSGNPNINHSGPPSTGKRVENFVIMLKPNENAVCIMNTSAQFCKMAVDFYFEKPRRSPSPRTIHTKHTNTPNTPYTPNQG